MTEELNKKLNNAMRESMEMPELWKDKEWTVKKSTKEGAFWYTDGEGDNIIEGDTGELLVGLDNEDATTQWFGNDTPSLFRVTGLNESGVVVYADNNAIICNWTGRDAEDCALPHVFATGLIWMETEADNLIEAEEVEVTPDDLNNVEIIYDPNDDAQDFIEKLNAGQILAWRLKDGTLVIHPEDWN